MRPRADSTKTVGRLPGALLVVLATSACAMPLVAGGVAGAEARGGCRLDAAEHAVAWSVPSGAADRSRLDAWCAAVGAPIYADAGRPGRSPADSVLVVSWNTYVGGGDVVDLVRSLRAGEVTDGPPEHFVLLLQEIHRESGDLPDVVSRGAVPPRVAPGPPGPDRRDVLAVARELELFVYYVPSMRNGAAGPGEAEEDRGNAILSTLPLTGLRAIELPFESQRRVAAVATVESETASGERWSLRVASVHLDTRSVGRRLWASAGAGRRRQAEALVRALPAGEPVVVGGDLNTWSLASLEGALPVLAAHFPDTPDRDRRPTFETRWGFRRTLDHLFFDLPDHWTASQRRLDRRYGSDHYPLIAWVSVVASQPR